MSYFQSQKGSFSRGLGFGPRALSPFIKWIIIVNVFLLIVRYIFPQTIYIFGLTPQRFFSEFPNLLYQPFTYMFFHGGIAHIFFNMFVLWMFGTEIEFRWGSKRFGRFYILGGLAGALLTLIVQSSQNIPMIGASAAIYGVLVAYWVMFPNRYLYLYFLFPIKVKWAIPGLMIIGFLFGGIHVAHFAHLGGAIFGFLYMKSDWRWFSWSSKIKQYQYQHKNAKLEKNRQKAEEIMKRVDSILDKINEVGLENISKEDREFLKEASDKLSEKKSMNNNGK